MREKDFFSQSCTRKDAIIRFSRSLQRPSSSFEKRFLAWVGGNLSKKGLDNLFPCVRYISSFPYEEFRKQTDYISIVFIHTESAHAGALVLESLHFPNYQDDIW